MNLIKVGILSILSLGLFISCSSEAPAPSEGETQMAYSDDNGGITLPDGFKAVVVADSVGKARHITVADNGDIYVNLEEEKNGYGIAALRDNDADGIADTTQYFGPYTGTGIQIHNGYLYVSSDTSVVRYEMTEGQLVPQGEAEMVVEGFPDQGSHAAKSFTFDQSGNLYVNIGAPSNACQEESRTPGSAGMEPCPQLEGHGGIWKFSADQVGQTYMGVEQRYATGIRNSVALDWDTNSNQLYVVQHGRDQLNTLWPEYYDAQDNAELPAEEMFAVNEGDNFGWPYAYYNWKTNQKLVSPEYGGDGETAVEGDEYEDPVIAFPGHWGPNDLLFYSGSQFPESYHNGAFIAFHGSWNRAPEPQAGYKVAFVPFDGGEAASDHQVFADGFAGQDSLRSPGNAQYRPMGLATGSDGSLYISDSQKGKIWRVVYTNENAQ
ncbi:PQQ-dependent sugar dehydrogenase [Fodinibius salsisoli]|uniref:PQQ-dependent sugar dehydrogenase n=1 Tax=Fodinibius salsisoli TaxID=2820877 RepID=A0ABT3PQQ8_9BACT|nr:PQQ-dependent sugar dehydrogenase [Fodinibius salsisoli]MCW9708189.1 PQQ-dependent sugar dehydrogenase [Fodinibius salsisoli]